MIWWTTNIILTVWNFVFLTLNVTSLKIPLCCLLADCIGIAAMVPTLKHHAFYVGVHVLNNLVRAHSKALLFDKGIIKVLCKVVCNLMSFWRHVELDFLIMNQHPKFLVQSPLLGF